MSVLKVNLLHRGTYSRHQCLKIRARWSAVEGKQGGNFGGAIYVHRPLPACFGASPSVDPTPFFKERSLHLLRNVAPRRGHIKGREGGRGHGIDSKRCLSEKNPAVLRSKYQLLGKKCRHFIPVYFHVPAASHLSPPLTDGGQPSPSLLRGGERERERQRASE